MPSKTATVLVSLTVLGIAVGTSVVLVRSKAAAEQSEPIAQVPLVETVLVEAAHTPLTLVATGVVEPSKRVELSAEKPGRVTSVSPNLVPGGVVTRGEVLLRIDPTPYALAVDERRTQVEQAQLALQVERARTSTAAREWQQLNEGRDLAEANPLALRKPQVAAAEVALASARAALARAEDDLSRAVVRAPFNAAVLNESVELGSYVNPGTMLASLIGSDLFWARLSLPLTSMQAVLTALHQGQDVPARVVQDVGGQTIVREGKVARYISELDAQSRTAQVIVEIPNPLQHGDTVPLLVGAFVQVTIDLGVDITRRKIPRTALLSGQRVWVVGANDTLSLRTVDVAGEDNDNVYVRAGVEAGERVVTSDAPGLADGLRVRVMPSEESAKEGA